MTSCKNILADYANMFKAFIGSNYLSISFAFAQSGMALGIVLLVVIVVVTEHCCALIVKCKRLMLRKVYATMPLDADGNESLETSEAKALMNKKTQMGDIGEYTFGLAGRAAVNASLFVTQFGFCVNYFIFVGNTLREVFPSVNTSEVNETASGDEDDSVVVFAMRSTAPNLIWLVMAPLPVFALFSLLRSVRKLGFVSIIANISIFVGCVVIFSYIVDGFTVSHDFEWAIWSTAPVTIGLMISSFEGIGTILPIEGSMVGNQHNFRRFLLGGIGGVALILVVFGVLGYLRYGAGTGQLLVQNIPENSVLSSVVDVTLIVGVLFTFPLQQVPVVTMVETLLFTKGGLLHSTNSEAEPLVEAGNVQGGERYGVADDREEEEEEGQDLHAMTMDKYRIRAPNWQRCIVRFIIVLAELGVAIAMREKYAYVSAFTGALGSTFLAFIVPCAAHLRLAWEEISLPVKIKDFVIVILGFTVSILSITITLKEIIQG